MIPVSPTLPDAPEPESRARSPGSSRFVWLGIFILALALRLFQLGHQNLWYDENLMVVVSQSGGKDLIEALEIESNKPPLYFLVMQQWLKWGGTEFWLRLPSAIWGALTCWLVMASGQELFGKRRGWIFGLLLAVSPFHIYYSQEARMYALLGLTGTGALLFTCRFCRSPSWGNAGLYLGCATLSCYTFTYGVFLLPFACLFSRCFQPRLSRPALAGFWATNVLVALLFCPWIPRLLTSVQSGSGLQKTVRGPVTEALAYAFCSLGLGTTFGPTTEQLRVLGRRVFVEHPVTGGLMVGGLLLVALVAAIGLKFLWPRNRNGFWFTAIGLGIFWGCPAVLNVLKPGIPYNARYAILALIPFTMAAGGFVFWAAETGVWRKILALAFAGCVGLSLVNHYFDPRYARDDVRSAARFLQSLQPPPRRLIVCADYMELVLKHYYHGPAKLLPLKVSGLSVEAALDPLAKELAEGGTFGLVYARPDHGDPHRILPAWLKQHYPLKLEKSWTGVALYLFDAEPSTAKP